jgi:drug/metabolite transporter (DMT)-like permease
MANNRRRLGHPHLRVIAAAVLFSTGGAAIKTAAFSGIQVSSLRAGIAAAVLLLWVRGRIVLAWPVVAIGIFYAATLTLFVTSTKLTTAANAIFLQSTAPLYIVVLAPLLIGERLHKRQALFLAAMAAGLILCFAGRSAPTTAAPDPVLGNVLGVLCGLAWAFTLIGFRWGERRQAGIGISAVIAGNVIACLIGLPFLQPLPPATIADWLTLVYLGTIQIALAYIFLTSAVTHLPALEVSLLLLLEPVLNPIWTWMVYGENPGRWTIVGGAIIVAATGVKAIQDAPGATKNTKGGHPSTCGN